MKMIALTRVGASLVLAGSLLSLGAAEATLKVGDAAPKLQVSKWVQGDPVANLEKEKAYLVEFWATWCGPCRVSIPHLNEIHTRYQDQGLVVIGQDVWERDESAVEPFVKKMGDKMTYRVALDDKDGSENGKMAETWMQAAGRNGIPSAFLVDKQGRIAWIGHPMELQDDVIKQVLAGSFDLAKAAADYEVSVKNEAQLNLLWREFSGAMREKQWDKAEAKLDAMEKLLPEDQRGGLQMTRFRLSLSKEDYDGAFRLARQLSDAEPGNAMLQNQLAWTLVTLPKNATTDLDLADTIATRASDATQGKDANILDTLARVRFMKGQKDQAIALQQKALDLADDDMKEQFQKTLDSYKKGELPEAE